MHRDASERGAALILLLGIIATLAILASMLVFVLINEQSATAKERSRKASAAYAEGALEGLAQQVKNSPITQATGVPWPMPQGTNDTTPGTLRYLAAQLKSSLGLPAAATVTYTVYDNQPTIDQNVTWDRGGATQATKNTPDGMMWMQVDVTYQKKKTRMRVLVQLVNSSWLTALPRAVLFSDTSITANGTSDLYAVNPDLTPDTTGYPFPTSIMAGNSISVPGTNTGFDLAAPGVTPWVQSLALKANQTISIPANHTYQDRTAAAGTVGLLSDYFDQGAQADLGDEAQQGSPTQALSTGAVVDHATIEGNSTYGGTGYATSGDVVVNGNLSLGSGTRYFHSLYVKGNLTQSTGGTFNCTALYVSGNLTITSNSATTFQLGPTYVGGSVTWNGNGSFPSNVLTIKTTNYNDATKAAGPFWVGTLFDCNGAFNVTMGYMWISGNAGTGNVAIQFDGPTSGSYYSTVMSPLMATTEKTVTTGKVNFGTAAIPMIYYMQCDNDGLYSNTADWGSSGTFYGLMVLMEAVINITGGDGTIAHPSIMGAIFEGTPYVSGTTASTSDITLSGKSTVVYNQAIIDKTAAISVKTTAITVQVVPGSWQQLSPNGG